MRVVFFDDEPSFVEAAAAAICEAAREAVSARGRFSLALAGGSTPRPVYTALADGTRCPMPWARTLIFFGDERLVPHDAPDSNCRMARQTLLDHVPLPAENVFPMPVHGEPAKLAVRYEADLRRALGAPAPGVPVLDLVLLGMGEDGHTASIFPGTAPLPGLVAAVPAPLTLRPAVPRLTMTPALLNAARRVLFLVAGEKKRRLLREILAGGEAARRYPAAGIKGAGEVLWLAGP